MALCVLILGHALIVGFFLNDILITDAFYSNALLCTFNLILVLLSILNSMLEHYKSKY